ncbi:hypothetical protein HYR69_09820, partial [Candidatus Sumerlaeota bacterium]|nr:hypothetical protein [Candidatus Sumerlaeota bacterium]
IVERGTHTELLAKGGRYKTLYDKQYKFEMNRFVNPGEELKDPAGADAAVAALPSNDASSPGPGPF